MQSTTPEVWKAIPGYEGLYEVSNQGRVKSLARTVHQVDGRVRRFKETIKACPITGMGYRTVMLYKDNKGSQRHVHRLVLESFVGPCPPGSVACHWDDDRLNNTLSNLRWGSRSDNAYDKVRNGRCPKASKTHCIRGHEFTESNTYVRRGRPGTRECKTCNRERSSRFHKSK